jgi:hypothetical protein
VAATPAPLTGSQGTAVSASLTGLSPGTPYYYRAVASGPGGTVADSSVQSFTTAVATAFANLTWGSITFGAGSVNLSGQLVTNPGTPFPAGSVVTVSINGVAQTPALNPDGSFQFSYQFSQAMGAAQSPYAVTYTYTDPSGQFAPTSDSSRSLTVTQATPTVSVADADGTYTGSAFAATATVAGVVAGVDNSPAATLEGVAPTVSYYSGTFSSVAQLAGLTPLAGAPAHAGAYTVLASFPGSADYRSGQALTTFTIAQATPTITWVSPADITYGTALSATQLDATADAAGTFAYSPDLGAVLGAGSHSLSVTFTPTDTADYTSASVTRTVTLTVLKATPTITWADPAAIVFGTPLGAAQLDATADAPGTFAYSPDSGAVLQPGTHSLSVTFTPTDTTNFTSNSVTRTAILTVLMPTPASVPGSGSTAAQLGVVPAMPALQGAFLASVAPPGTPVLGPVVVFNDLVYFGRKVFQLRDRHGHSVRLKLRVFYLATGQTVVVLSGSKGRLNGHDLLAGRCVLTIDGRRVFDAFGRGPLGGVQKLRSFPLLSDPGAFAPLAAALGLPSPT